MFKHGPEINYRFDELNEMIVSPARFPFFVSNSVVLNFGDNNTL